MTPLDGPAHNLAIAFSVLLILVTANASDSAIAGANVEQPFVSGGFPMSPTPKQSIALEGQDWTLTGWAENNQTVDIVGTSPTIQFSGQEVSGFGSCNRYRAMYQQPDGDRIQIGDIVATRMACVDMTLMEQERRYLSAIRAAQSLQCEANQLTLSYRSPSGQQGQLLFRPLPQR